jgi:hypothetical protein
VEVLIEQHQPQPLGDYHGAPSFRIDGAFYDTLSGDHSPGLPACFLWSLPLITLAGVSYRVVRGASVVGILEVGLAVFVERADALDSVGMDGGAPVRLHHDRDGLLDWLALAHPDRLLDCLDRSR